MVIVSVSLRRRRRSAHHETVVALGPQRHGGTTMTRTKLLFSAMISISLSGLVGCASPTDADDGAQAGEPAEVAVDDGADGTIAPQMMAGPPQGGCSMADIRQCVSVCHGTVNACYSSTTPFGPSAFFFCDCAH
jgi:hypothetical protein